MSYIEASQAATIGSTINWATDVIVPLASALIGGLMALWGVHITLKRDKLKYQREKEESAQPFFSIFSLYDSRFSNSQKNTFSFVTGDTYDDKQSHLVANIVNSEKVEFVIDEFYIDNIHYHPYGYEKQFISKGSVCTIIINVKTGANLSDAVMYVTDVNFKKHTYKLKCRNELVIDFIEVQKEV